MNKRFVILIAGPTAVGKTAMSIDIARYFQSEIISADSRQCYREMNIGVARPSPEELDSVPHHFIASHSIHDELTAADFEHEALALSEQIFQKQNILVLAGGTGLYIRAFLNGLDSIPAVPVELRNSLNELYKENGRDWLRDQILAKDPLYVQQGDLMNPHRMLRALEVWEYFGKSILSFHQHLPKSRNFNIIRIGLDMPREYLYERINMRVEQMINAGLLEEASSLKEFESIPPLQTVGYRELFPYFKGEYSLDKAISLIQQNTRHYAKRQLTWFRNQENLKWFHPGDVASVKEFIEDELKKEY
jgi:tRNA dimethylallyltransferase